MSNPDGWTRVRRSGWAQNQELVDSRKEKLCLFMSTVN